MFENVTKIANSIATGAGYGIIPLVAASLVDTLLQTHLASHFDKVGYLSILGFATLYCFVAAVTISTRNEKQVTLGRKLDGFTVDRISSFLGVCLAIGGLPAYTRNSPIPIYVALCFFAAIAVCFALAMWSVDNINRWSSQGAKQMISLVFLLVACLIPIATLTIAWPMLT